MQTIVEFNPQAWSLPNPYKFRKSYKIFIELIELNQSNHCCVSLLSLER